MSDNIFQKYDEAIKKEEKATARLKKLAAKIAKECHSVWHYGDGKGGYVISVIEEEMYKYVNRPIKSVSPLRKPIPGSIRTMVYERNEYRCVLCGSHKRLVIDHIHPVAKGGSNHPDNLQTLCWPCNSKKSDRVA